MIGRSKRKLYKVSNTINIVPAEDGDSNESDFPKLKEEFLKLEYKMAFERDSQFMSARIIVKGWCITILAGIFSFLYNNRLFSDNKYFIIFCMVILFFYLVEVELAAYQKFCNERIDYIEKEMDKKKERIIKEKIPDFFGKDKDKRAFRYFGNCISCPTIAFFYGFLYLISALSWSLFSSEFSLWVFALLLLFTILVLSHRVLLNSNRDNPGPVGIKSRYSFFVIVLPILLFFLILVLREFLELQEWITVSATLGTAFAASLAGIIALAVADKPSRSVKFAVKTEIADKEIEEYDPGKLPEDLKSRFGKVSFHSYRVNFTITNQSGFTLKHPIVTFRLPTDLMHPHKVDGNWILGYNSNMPDVPTDMRRFTYQDTVILSNMIIPYLNKDQKLPIWIRMCLLEGDTKSRDVYIDLNCDNAEGSTEKVTILPEDLISSIKH